jgi:hypothetical protein
MEVITKIILFLSVIIFFKEVNAQPTDSLDFRKSIYEIVNDSTSHLFYPKLKEKFKENPGTITMEDCYYLYYGRIFQKTYNPVSFIVDPEIGNFLRSLSVGDCDAVLNVGISILDKNPVDLRVLLHICNCISQKKDQDTLYHFQKRFKYLLDGILSTGTGNSMKTAIKITDLEDEYVLKGILNFLGGKEQLTFENHHAYSIWNKKDKKLFFEDLISDK